MKGGENRSITEAAIGFGASLDYVTIVIGEQLLGLPIGRVHDVFIANRFTPVPLAPPEIVGLLNLRGRVVTAMCLNKRLGRPFSLRTDGKGDYELVAVGIEHEGEAYALIVDAVGEVMRLDHSTFEPVPVHLDRSWAALAAGIHRLEDRLLVVLDVDAVLKIDIAQAA